MMMVQQGQSIWLLLHSTFRPETENIKITSADCQVTRAVWENLHYTALLMGLCLQEVKMSDFHLKPLTHWKRGSSTQHSIILILINKYTLGSDELNNYNNKLFSKTISSAQPHEVKHLEPFLHPCLSVSNFSPAKVKEGDELKQLADQQRTVSELRRSPTVLLINVQWLKKNPKKTLQFMNHKHLPVSSICDESDVIKNESF